MPARQKLSARNQLNPQDERWKLTEQIITSDAFRKAPRLSSFLQYIVVSTLAGGAEELSERQIGIDVFERSVTYNPGDDSIVRANARHLRARLERYFQQEGSGSRLILRIPKGSYIPVFELRNDAPPVISGPVPLDAEPPMFSSKPEVPARRKTRRWDLVAAACVAVALCAIAIPWARQSAVSNAGFDRFWRSLLSPDRRTLIVPADTTLFSLAGKLNSPLKLSEYLDHRAASGEEQIPLTEAAYLGHQYTSIADLNIAFRIGRLHETQGKLVDVRYARNLTLEDAKSANLILIGGLRSNPWTQLYQDRIDYLLHSDNNRNIASVFVRSPVAGEKNHYEAPASGEQIVGFGLIAMVPGLDGHGNTLLLEGTNMAGTEAACDYVLDPVRFSEIEQKITGSKGEVRHFEALLSTQSLQGSASKTQLLAWRLLP